jgi:hypothetical protein
VVWAARVTSHGSPHPCGKTKSALLKNQTFWIIFLESTPLKTGCPTVVARGGGRVAGLSGPHGRPKTGPRTRAAARARACAGPAQGLRGACAGPARACAAPARHPCGTRAAPGRHPGGTNQAPGPGLHTLEGSPSPTRTQGTKHRSLKHSSACPVKTERVRRCSQMGRRARNPTPASPNPRHRVR